MSARDPHLAPAVSAARFRMNSPAEGAHRQPRMAGLVRGVMAAGLAFSPVLAAAQPLPNLPGLSSGMAPGMGEPPTGPDMSRPHSRGFGILLDQASYWSAQGRPDLAQQALERLLALDQNNPDVLATAAEMAAQGGERQVAETYVARLNQVAPGSSAAFRAAAALRALAVDQGVLAEARRLAQAGQQQAAMQSYRRLFPQGEVPPIYASEYYQTLAGTSEENFEEARQGLSQVLERSPENRALQFSYAQLLTYNEVHRPEGLQRLEQLASIPSVGAAARSAWRQALLWQGSDPDTAEQIAHYLKTNPPDPEIEAKLAEAKATVIPQWVIDRMTAWGALAEGRLDDAETSFNSALAGDPNDSEAVSGLATVRKMQGRFPEARELLARAIEIAPFRRDEFEERLGDLSGYPAAPATGRGAAPPPPPSPSTLAWQNLNRGRLEQAASHARRAQRGGNAERLQAETVLGSVALRRRDYPQAERHFRAALAINPRFTAAQAGLFEVLQRQRRFADADRFVQETGFRPSAEALALRASTLREEAAATRDPEAKIALLHGALAADPRNVWAAYDMARLLKARGQRQEARRIEGELAARREPEALFAAALLADADDRPADTVARLEAVPARSRPEDAERLLVRNRQLMEVRQLERAARGNPRSEAARRLIALAGQPDPTGEAPAAIIRAFTRLRQPANADAAARAANPGGPAATPEARVTIAGALLEAGRSADAEALAASVERDPRLGQDRRQQAATVRSGSAAEAASRLSRGGEQRAALERLQPALNAAPEDPQVRLALARIYANSGREAEASEIAEGILRRDPRNSAARMVAGEAAVAGGSYGRAEEILKDGRAQGADELQMALLEARIARARGDQRRARQALEEAARLRALQLRPVDAERATLSQR